MRHHKLNLCIQILIKSILTVNLAVLNNISLFIFHRSSTVKTITDLFSHHLDLHLNGSKWFITEKDNSCGLVTVIVLLLHTLFCRDSLVCVKQACRMVIVCLMAQALWLLAAPTSGSSSWLPDWSMQTLVHTRAARFIAWYKKKKHWI